MTGRHGGARAADDRVISCGGVSVSCGVARAALAVLAGSPGLMVAQPLTRAGSPLARCDYHRAAAPYLRRYASLPAAGRGAAGRHLTKSAFCAALADLLAAADEAEPGIVHHAAIKAMTLALASDYTLAAEVASAAITSWQREHAARLRAELRAGVKRAVAACEARRGQFRCASEGACGTGGCQFAAGLLASISVPAGPGRQVRPGNHSGGQGYGLAAAEAALAAAVPFTPGLRCADTDTGSGADTLGRGVGVAQAA